MPSQAVLVASLAKEMAQEQIGQPTHLTLQGASSTLKVGLSDTHLRPSAQERINPMSALVVAAVPTEQ